TVAFYRDVLGFAVYRSWDREEDRGTIFIAPNGRGLIEIEAGAVQPSIQGGFYLEVSDVEAWYERVRAAGAPVRKPLGLTSYGHVNFKTADPNEVEVTFFRYEVEPA
ncbi:MAG TPA: VOC family protein, partial [Thermoanaerobaculia bacterium]